MLGLHWLIHVYMFMLIVIYGICVEECEYAYLCIYKKCVRTSIRSYGMSMSLETLCVSVGISTLVMHIQKCDYDSIQASCYVSV